MWIFSNGFGMKLKFIYKRNIYLGVLILVLNNQIDLYNLSPLLQVVP